MPGVERVQSKATRLSFLFRTCPCDCVSIIDFTQNIHLPLICRIPIVLCGSPPSFFFSWPFSVLFLYLILSVILLDQRI